MKFIYRLFIDFKFARRKLGGKWYKVREIDVGFAAGIEHWTTTPTDDVVILEEEDYS